MKVPNKCKIFSHGRSPRPLFGGEIQLMRFLSSFTQRRDTNTARDGEGERGIFPALLDA